MLEGREIIVTSEEKGSVGLQRALGIQRGNVAKGKTHADASLERALWDCDSSSMSHGCFGVGFPGC